MTYQSQINKFKDLCHFYNLSDELTELLAASVCLIMRDEFKAGNVSGIRWARSHDKTQAVDVTCGDCFGTMSNHLRASCDQ